MYTDVLYASSQWLLVDLVLRGMVMGLLALLALVLWKDTGWASVKTLGFALALGMIAYVLQTTPMFDRLASRFVEIGLVAVSNGNNPLFWFFALALFDDEQAARPWQWGLWTLVVCFAGLTLWTHGGAHGVNPEGFHALAHRVLAWLPMLFAGLTVLAAVRHWRADLIEQRRWLRVFIVVAGLLYMLGSAVARLDTADGRFTSRSGTLDMVVLGVIVLLFAWRLLVLDAGALFPLRVSNLPGGAPSVGPVGRPAAVQPADPGLANLAAAPNSLVPGVEDTEADAAPLAAKLQQLMQEKQIFREENLTIARLAARLDVPEYRLRRVINQRLGYRNFNAFLNSWRLDHVTRAMSEPTTAQLPVLTLALDAGFQSIGPFNRAFKLQFGMTPTEFRAKHRADSGIG